MLERSKAVFSFLFKDKGFRITEDTGIDEKSFGNWLWEAKSPDFKLRCINDRGFVSVDVGSNASQNEWFDLNSVKNLILGGDIMEVSEYEKLATFLKRNYSEVTALFSSQNISETVARLHKLEDERVRQQFPKLFESKDKNP